MFAQLNHDCIALIAEFAGTDEQWKRRFSEDVLPCVEQGYALVAMVEDKPCANCYFYGKHDLAGVGGVCMLCVGNADLVQVSFADMRGVENFKKFEKFSDFKNYRDSYHQGLCMITRDDIYRAVLEREVRRAVFKYRMRRAFSRRQARGGALLQGMRDILKLQNPAQKNMI